MVARGNVVSTKSAKAVAATPREQGIRPRPVAAPPNKTVALTSSTVLLLATPVLCALAPAILNEQLANVLYRARVQALRPLLARARLLAPRPITTTKPQQQFCQLQLGTRTKGRRFCFSAKLVEDLQLQTQLSEQGDFLVVKGQLPSPKNDGPLLMRTTMTTSSCCGGTNVHNKEQEGTCCSAAPQQEANKEPSTTTTTSTPLDPPADSQQQQQPPTSSKKSFVLGGLELPETSQNWDQMSDFTVLYIGDAHTRSRQYVNTMLRLLSLPDPP
jgi:hypothetical protein